MNGQDYDPNYSQYGGAGPEGRAEIAEVSNREIIHLLNG